MKQLVFIFLILFVSCTGNEQSVKVPKDLDSLVVFRQKAFNADPKNDEARKLLVEALVKRGNKRMKTQDFKGALKDAATALGKDSTIFEARLLYADVLNNSPERSEDDKAIAKRHYKVLLKQQPKNADVLVGLASSYAQLMDFESAFKYIRKAQKIEPRNRDSYTLEGSIYRLLAQMEENPKYLEKAKEAYERAVQEDPKFYEADLMLGMLYEAEGNPICMEYYTTAVKLQPKNPEVIFSLAYAKQMFNEPKEALRLYRKMVLLDTAFYQAQALNQIGVIKQYEYKDIDSAIYYYNSATLSNPTLANAWHNLGVCYEQKGERIKAITAYRWAIKYDPNMQISKDRIEALL
jgi:tetratricopeptide (TPR) repeat protein